MEPVVGLTTDSDQVIACQDPWSVLIVFAAFKMSLHLGTSAFFHFGRQYLSHSSGGRPSAARLKLFVRQHSS